MAKPGNTVKVTAAQYRQIMGLDKAPEKPLEAAPAAMSAPSEPMSLPDAIAAGAEAIAIKTALEAAPTIADYYQRLITALRIAIAVYKKAAGYPCAFKPDLDIEAAQCDILITALDKEQRSHAIRSVSRHCRATFGQRGISRPD